MSLEIWMKLRDALQMGADACQEKIESLEPKESKSSEKPTLAEIESLKYTEQTSSKGNYHLVTRAENTGNSAFDKLHSYLTEKGGFGQLHGFKAWVFSNDPENKIGMR